MTRRLFALAVLAVLVSGCARCGAAPKADAGSAPLPITHSLDLKSALLLIFPEYRGVVQFVGSANLTRVYSGDGALEKPLAQALASNGFVPVDGGLGWERPPYFVENTVVDGRPAARLWFNFYAETVERVMQAPSPVSSLELGMLLPREGPGLLLAREAFEVRADYVAINEHRAATLARQTLDLLRANGQWETLSLPDGWLDAGTVDALPERFEAAVRSTVDGTRVEVRRNGPQVRVILTLRTAGQSPTSP